MVRSRGRPVDKRTSSEGSVGYKVESLGVHDENGMTCYAICIIPNVLCIPYNYSFQQASFQICPRETQFFFHICRLLAMRWSMEEYFKLHSTDYKKPLEILHWDGLLHLKELFEWPMFATLSLEWDNDVTRRKTLKRLTKLLDWLHGIGHGYDEDMESRAVMVPTNGMVHKVGEELENDVALLFGLIFLAYLDIGGECFCFLFPLFIFMSTSYFCLVLAVLS